MPVYEQEWQASPAIQNQHLMHTGVTYNGTIYTPFDNTVPSDHSNVGASYAPGRQLYTGNFDNPTDPGSQSNESPIGEPWIMVIFAILFACMTAWRQYNKLKIETRDNGNHEK